MSIFGPEGSELDTLVQWRDPMDFFCLKDVRPEIFYDRIEPSDIK
jgi:hypothetical protein